MTRHVTGNLPAELTGVGKTRLALRAAAALAEYLAERQPPLMLATSREALNITGETALAVPPLAAPEAGRSWGMRERKRHVTASHRTLRPF